MMWKSGMPNGWRSTTLGAIGKLDRGRSRHRPRYDPTLYGGPYPFIQTGDVKASGGRITRYQQTYSEVGLAQSRLWPKGALCITIAANIADTGILCFPACFPDSVVGFIGDERQCSTPFIEYVFRYLRRTIRSEASGTVQDNINLEILGKVQVLLPPLAEQHAIVSILGALDDKLDLNRRMNETLEELARTLFKSWFVDFDPVRAKAEGGKPVGMDAETAALFPSRVQASELGGVPEGWGVRALDQIANFRNGLALQNFRPQGSEVGLPVIKIAQLRAGTADGAERARADIEPACVVDDGDILFSWSGSLLVEVWCGGKGALNQHLFRVSSPTVPKWFYYQQLLRELPSFQAIAAAKATTMGHIQRHHLAQAKCAVPPDAVIRGVDRTFSSMIERQIESRLESRTLGDLRDLLLPKLISGELRVQDAEKLAEVVL